MITGARMLSQSWQEDTAQCWGGVTRRKQVWHCSSRDWGVDTGLTYLLVNVSLLVAQTSLNWQWMVVSSVAICFIYLYLQNTLLKAYGETPVVVPYVMVWASHVPSLFVPKPYHGEGFNLWEDDILKNPKMAQKVTWVLFIGASITSASWSNSP